MAKFCTNCGRPLKEGEECTCKREVKIESSEAKDYINQLFDLVKGIFLKPIDTIQSFSKESNLTFGICLMVACSIFCGFFGMFFLKEVTNQAFSWFLNIGVEVPYFRYFMMLTVSSFFHFFCFTALLYFFFHHFFHKMVSWKKIVAFLGVHSLILSMTFLVCLIFLFLSLKFMIFLLLIGCLYAITLFIQGLEEISQIEKNKLSYLVVGTSSIMILLVGYLIPAIF